MLMTLGILVVPVPGNKTTSLETASLVKYVDKYECIGEQ